MVDFDPDDNNIPQKLRNRFLSWETDVPRLQYSQYGPINKYLTLYIDMDRHNLNYIIQTGPTLTVINYIKPINKRHFLTLE